MAGHSRVLLAGSLSLTACNAGSGAAGAAAAPAADKSKVTVALTGEPVNLDFTKTAGAAIPQALMSNVYEGLVKIDQNGKIVPLLAESWTLSPDGKVYTFKLHEGAKFSNGEAFTASDVKFSIERVKSDAWVSSLKSKMDVVDSVDCHQRHRGRRHTEAAQQRVAVQHGHPCRRNVRSQRRGRPRQHRHRHRPL